MIIEEYIEDNTRVRHYSDENLKIRQIETGIIYDDAVDVIPCKYTYEETDIPIEPKPEPNSAIQPELFMRNIPV
jgi:hypothetical protein